MDQVSLAQQHISFERLEGQAGQVGLISLRRPHALNALTLAMCQGINQHLLDWEQDPSIKAVVIRGEGERAFCAGGDVRMVYEHGQEDVKASMSFFREEYTMNYRIATFSKPYIALLHGITMGGGAGVSLHGSHVVAADDLVFAMPETGIGFYPDIGASHFLNQCPGKIGLYLGLTGKRIRLLDCLYAKLVHYALPKSQFDEFITALQESDLSVDAIAGLLKGMQKGREGQGELVMQRENIDHCFRADTLEGIIENLRQCGDWGESVADDILTKSPMSLKVTLAQFKRSQGCSIQRCLQQEYQLTGHFVKHADFYEGVRAAVIDKDKQPLWQPPSLERVDAQEVASYFVASEDDLKI